MKKVFLSVPMKGRTKENIEKSLEKMRAITKIALEGEEIEFINTLVQEKPPYTTQNEAIWYLGKSIQLLSQADVFIGVETPYWLEARGCNIEATTFNEYTITNPNALRIKLPLALVMSEKEYNELHYKYQEDERRCNCGCLQPVDNN